MQCKVIPIPIHTACVIDIAPVRASSSPTCHVCYICFGSKNLDKSPCECQSPCHISPCLRQSVEINGNSSCTICRSNWTSKELQALCADKLEPSLTTLLPTRMHRIVFVLKWMLAVIVSLTLIFFIYGILT